MKKRIVSLMMAMLMVFSLMPTSVLAADATEVVACAVEGCIVTGEHTEHMFNVVPEGDDVSATEGDDASAIEGDDASAIEGDDASATEGDDASATEGDDASATEGDDASATEGDDASATEGDDASATEGDDASASEGDEAATPAVCVENCLLAEGHEGDCYVCEEGCILEGSAEHEENGWECFVWIPCSLTEGCELADGHEGECTGADVFAPATVTVSGVTSAYIVVGTAEGGLKENAKNDTLYYVNNKGVIVDGNGTAVTFDAGTYTIWYGTSGSTANRAFYKGTFTVSDTATAVTASLSSTRTTKATTADAITEDQWNWATCVYYNTTKCDHIHIRVAGSYTINVGGTKYEATVSNPQMTVYVNGEYNTSKTWSGTTSYEWNYKTNIALSNEIEVHLLVDLTYYDEAQGKNVTLEDVDIVYNNMTGRDRWIEFIAICDGFQGFDFTVSIQDIQKVIEYYTVIYQWKVRQLNGELTDSLPASLGAHTVPASVSGLAEGTEYVYNTGYVQGTSYYDYENGLLYTFQGWDTYSTTSTWSVTADGTTYIALDDNDKDASNNQPITIQADTWINGLWIVEELDPSDAYLMVKKDVVVESGDEAYVKNYLQNVGKMFISIDPGIDQNGDDAAQVDVDYPALITEDGKRVDVYQYDTPFVFTEKQADVPGYTRTVKVTVTENSNLSGGSTTDTANITITPEYDPDQAPYNLGTVTYTNTYTKNVGKAVSVYPSLYLLKSASDNGFQAGVTFTLYSDAACTTEVGTYTTDENGQLTIAFDGKAAGTYYLKETEAVYGYVADPYVYTITLTAPNAVEELRWNAEKGFYEYVQVTYYSLSISKDKESTATTNGIDYLHIYNDPILGKLNLSKATTGLADADKENLSATVIVHGPITRDDTNAITDIGGTWTLTLNKDNNWTTTLENLRVGEYLVHESFASVHGYTWTGVTYVNLSTVVYNNITSGVFKVTDSTPIDLVLTNTYEEWTEADFYIHKVNESGSKLAGAEFTLYSDAELKNVVTTKTTAADGYAHFVGFDAEGTYYLKETKAPAGYYLDDTVYKVEIKAVTDPQTNKTTYEPKISVKNESGDWVEVSAFDNTTDLLEIVNYPVLGSLTIKKDIFVTSTDGETIPTGLTEIKVNVSGPGYNAVVELNASNEWRATINNLHLGTYTIVEQDANVPGYTLSTTYADATVTLSEAEPGKTVSGAAISGASTITNTYTRNEETYEKPTSLTIKKVDGENKALAGAVFSLTRKSDGTTVTYTTNANGVAVFDFLSGSIVDGSPVNGEYTLKEVTAPVGYAVPETEWTVRVAEDDGKLSVYVLNNDNNTYENFWQWVVESVTGNSQFEKNGSVLTVTNHKVTGKLEISKKQTGESDGFVKEITVNVAGPNGYSEKIILDGTVDEVETTAWKTTLTGLELGEYSVTEAEVTMKEGFSYSVSMKDTDGSKISGTNVDGEVLLDISEHTDYVVSAAVEITNTYTKVTGDDVHVYPDFKVYKTDDQRNPLAGATFQLAGANLSQNLVLTADANGMITFAGLKPGTYTLTELSAPADYAKDDSVYQVTIAQDGDPVERLVNGKHVKYYYYGVSVTKNNVNVTLSNNTLTVLNHKVSGELVITKDFGANNAYTPKDIFVKVSGPNNFFGEYTLNATNKWTVTLTGLELGNYVVQEKDASIPGYTLTTTMQDTDGNVTYGNASDGRVALAVGDLEAGFTAAVVTAQVDITNTYTKNYGDDVLVLPKLNLLKLRTGTNIVIPGVEFTLYSDEACSTVVDTFTTDANGKLSIDFAKYLTGIKQGEDSYTFYLKETKNPDDRYAKNNTKYEITVAQTGKTEAVVGNVFVETITYDVVASGGVFDEAANQLTVFNEKISDDLTIKKIFPASNQLDVTKVVFNIVGTKDFVVDSKTYNANNPLVVEITGNHAVDTAQTTVWSKTIKNLPLDTYTVTEVSVEYKDGTTVSSANMDAGKTEKEITLSNNKKLYWEVTYAPQQITLSSGLDQFVVEVSNSFTNVHPINLVIKKTDANGVALRGAEFTVTRVSDNKLMATETTNVNGVVKFPGFVTEADYILEETKAPENYKLGAVSKWFIEVIGKDEFRTMNIYTYVNGNKGDLVKTVTTKVDDTTAKTATLTLDVENTRSVGELLLKKVVNYVDGSGKPVDSAKLPDAYKPANYFFNVTVYDEQSVKVDSLSKTGVVVPANGYGITYERKIPYGYSYVVEEVVAPEDVFASDLGNGKNTIGGKMASATVTITATNTYTIITETPGLNILKHEDGAAKVIAGAKFELYSDADCKNKIAEATSDADGRLTLPLTSVGTFYLKEVAPAAGYHPNDNVYTITTEYVYKDDTVNKIIKQSIVVDQEKWTDYKTMKLTNPDANPSDYEFHVINKPIKPVIISAEKVWNDDNYYARPDSVTVNLMRDGVKFDSVKLDASNNWHYVWNGGIAAGLTDEYTWTVEEAEVSGYTAAHTVENGHWVFTNTRTPNAIELTVTKEWIDNNDTSYKPASIEVQLMRDGEPYGPVVTLSDTNSWKHTWKTADDPAINDAHQWSVVEIVPEGYKATYSADGWKITNERIIRDLELTVNKVWENIPNGYEHPEELTVVLYKNGVAVEGGSAVLNEESDWSYTWTGLTDDAVWTVGEAIDDELYTPSWSEPVYETKVVDGKTIVTQAVTITNTLNWEEMDVRVTKDWVVPDGYTAIPKSVEVQLYRDGEAYGDSVKLSENNKWTYTWTDLPDCFTWEVKEVTIPRGYTAEVVSDAIGANWTITNTLVYREINVSVSKVWLNPTGYTKQPTSVAVVLYRDGVAHDTVTLSKDNNWSYKWTDLEDCFTWTVDEPNVPTNYSKKVTHIGNAWIITNAHKDIPLTGDDSNIWLWAGATGVAVVGLGASLALLLKKRKEEDEQA